jgi:hypothetical protein
MPFNPHLAGSRDFLVYWSTGQQLVHHANPYDWNALHSLEHSAGFTGDASAVAHMRNPPWMLPLVLPLGLMNAQAAALPWSLLMLGLLVFSVHSIWKSVGRPGTGLDWIGYGFPPALQCVLMGQSSEFLLLGLVLFLRLHRARPFWAGAALWFCSLKPHQFLPFTVVLLAWIVVSRSYRILWGATAAMAASCLLTLWIDPAAWTQYLQWAGASGIANEFIPCLGVVLRNLLRPSAEWVAFVPAAAGSLWAIRYYWLRRRQWDWIENGNMVMLVSLLVAPYGWIYDQSLAIPALLYGANRTRSRSLLAILGLLCLLIVVQSLLVGQKSPLYLWPAPAWLLWYWLARRSERPARMPAAPEALPLAIG